MFKKTILEQETIKLLEKINKSLVEMNVREQTNEMMLETNKLFDKSDKRVESSLNQIQNSFDRIHDKVFNFNNILIGAFLVLSTYPSEHPIMKLWTVIFPIFNMIFLIYVDFRQMEIHRFAAGEQDWTNEERVEYGNKISKQTRLSLLALLLSLICLMYLIYNSI